VASEQPEETRVGVFRLIFFGVSAFLAAVAIFIGAVTMLTALQSGAIMLSYTSDGRVVAETITRAADAGRFWRLFAAMGALPAVLGAAALWYAIRKLRSPA
jgi:hypothetical protein